MIRGMSAYVGVKDVPVKNNILFDAPCCFAAMVMKKQITMITELKMVKTMPIMTADFDTSPSLHFGWLKTKQPFELCKCKQQHLGYMGSSLN